MSEHTPGPWRIETPADELLKFKIHCIGDRPTIEIWANGEHHAQGFYHPIALVAHDDAANARLIAAAPDLLEACRALLKFNEELCEDVKVSIHYPSAVRARKAIAKAEGRTS